VDNKPESHVVISTIWRQNQLKSWRKCNPGLIILQQIQSDSMHARHWCCHKRQTLMPFGIFSIMRLHDRKETSWEQYWASNEDLIVSIFLMVSPIIEVFFFKCLWCTDVISPFALLQCYRKHDRMIAMLDKSIAPGMQQNLGLLCCFTGLAINLT